ncbi:MAG: endonuclease/exonuclease/phosphatase family metal-dependent hydrolase, partial [Gammaproteobacteria bacterium]
MKSIIRIASYNVKNFFDKKNTKYAKKAKEVRALAKNIDMFKPDIIGFQEVGSENSLIELNDMLSNPFEYYGLMEGNSYRQINLGFLSNFPFTLTSHKNIHLKDESDFPLNEFISREDYNNNKLSPLCFQRDLILAEFTISEKKLTIFNTHLKSRSHREWNNNSSDEIRLAESLMANQIIKNYENNYKKIPVIVIGDLNHTSEDASIKPLLKNLQYSDPISDEIIINDKNATTYWSKKGERIDYILLSTLANTLHIEGSAIIHKSTTAR